MEKTRFELKQWLHVFGPTGLKNTRKQYGDALHLEFTEGEYSEEGLPIYQASLPVKVLAFWGEETNSFADSNTANNGGGYFQPAGGVSLHLTDGGDMIVELEDMSCGDFGTREFWSITSLDRGMRWAWNEGSMEDACISPDEYIAEIADSIAAIFGLDIEELCDVTRKAVCTAAYYL